MTPEDLQKDLEQFKATVTYQLRILWVLALSSAAALGFEITL